MCCDKFHSFTFSYKLKEVGYDERQGQNVYGILINFRKEVEVIKSNWRIEPFTLLSRIGGIIGVGQTISWVVNTNMDIFINILVKINNLYYKRSFE